MEISILNLMDEKSCYDLLRKLRWPNSAICPSCNSTKVVKNGHHNNHSECQRYQCRKEGCNSRFDDLTATLFSGSKLPLKTWVACLYLMGLNLSNAQIAKELEISPSTAQSMTKKVREGIVKKNLMYSFQEWLKPTKSI